MEDGQMTYAGKVGTGYSTKLRGELKRDLSRDAIPRTSLRGAPRYRDATWVKPRLVAQVQFTEWTSDGKLRHPSFLGLRPDKTPEEVVREKPSRSTGAAESEPAPPEKKPAPRKSAAVAKKTAVRKPAPEIVLTKPDRLLYPRDGITKQDLADYYAAVQEPMIRALAGRPLSLEHWNEGIDKSSWFHQDIGRDAQDWMTLAETPTKTGRGAIRHLVVDRPEALRWLAQRSVLTVHMWHSHVPKLENPDWIVFDLDPAKGKGIEQAVEAAIRLHRLLDELKLPSYPKTSGKRGIHVFVPLAPGHSYEASAEIAIRIGDTLASSADFMTMERTLSKRRGRLYVDCMQNAFGKTIVAPYSPRAADGAPVSAPLKWSEVTRKLDPLKYNIRTMPARLGKLGDLFAPVLEGGVKLPRLR
jgi:bifunctional non-homologous end joining protein LigD